MNENSIILKKGDIAPKNGILISQELFNWYEDIATKVGNYLKNLEEIPNKQNIDSIDISENTISQPTEPIEEVKA